MNPDHTKVLALLALGDLALGLVLAAAGVSRDELVLSVAGTVLLISGAGMLLWVLRTRGRATLR